MLQVIAELRILIEVAHFEKKALQMQAAAAAPLPLLQAHSGFTIAVPETEAGSETEPATSVSSADGLPSASALRRQASPPHGFPPRSHNRGVSALGGFGGGAGGRAQEATSQPHAGQPYGGAGGSAPAGLATIYSSNTSGGGYGSPSRASPPAAGSGGSNGGSGGGLSPMQQRIAAAAAAASVSAMSAAASAVTSVAAHRSRVHIPSTPFGTHRTAVYQAAAAHTRVAGGSPQVRAPAKTVKDLLLVALLRDAGRNACHRRR